MFLTKLKFLAFLLLAGVVVGTGAVISTHVLCAGEKATEQTEPAMPKAAGREKPKQQRVETTKDAVPVNRVAENAKIQALLKERLALMKEMAAQAQALHERGTATAEEVAQANLLVLQAELDLCGSDKERLGVLEKIVELLKQKEKLIEQLMKTGVSSFSALLTARAARLEAQVVLERAKVKMTAPPR